MTPARSTVPGRPAAAVMGVLAAAVALAFGEMAAGVGGTRLSPVVAVGNRVIDLAPKAVRDIAIEMFGTSDKPALIAGICVVAALIAGGLGVLGRRRLPLAAVGFAGFGVLGALAAAVDEMGGAAAIAAPLLGAVAGVAVLWFLLTFTASAGVPPTADPAVGELRVDRRRFIGMAAGTLVLAGAALSVGRVLQQQSRAAASRLAVMLPRPARAAPPVPSAATLDVAGLSPLFTPNREFYRIDTALFVPQVPAEGWTLTIGGMVDREQRLTYDELTSLDMVEVDITLACVSNELGGSLVGNARWLGVPLLDLLEAGGVSPSADQVVGHSVDGFTAGFPLEAVRDGRPAIVAVGMNGEPLPLDHGFPARLVVAGLYGYVSATKWLSSIELTSFDAFDAYWIRRGWAERAPVKTMSRIDTPRRSARRRAGGTIPVAGVAWAPNRGIRAVEVQVDDEPWRPAQLSAELSTSTWRQWLYEWDASPGAHRLRVRATDGTGETQTDDRVEPFPDGATGWHTVTVDVRT